MKITKKILDELAPGQIFRVVTTSIQRFYEPFVANLKFVCVKGSGDKLDWAIYAGEARMTDLYISRHGDKVTMKDIIQNVCPCDDDVFELYRY